MPVAQLEAVGWNHAVVASSYLCKNDYLIWELNLQVTVPSLASVYNEYALKSQFETSIYLQVFFLGSICVGFA